MSFGLKIMEIGMSQEFQKHIADFWQIAYEVARFHHEKFNGNH